MDGGYEVVNEGSSFFMGTLQTMAEQAGVDIRGQDTGQIRETLQNAQAVADAQAQIAQGAAPGDVLPTAPIPTPTPPTAAAPAGSTHLALQNPFPAAFRTNLATQGIDVRELSSEQIQFLWENPSAVDQLRTGGGAFGR